MLDRYLIEHCSPTLASLKVANLFNVKVLCDKELEESIKKWNKTLNEKGVYIVVLKNQNKRALVYVYRKEYLRGELSKKETRGFMKGYGYEDEGVENSIMKLKTKLGQMESFPHEIGVFLGYPLGDIKGFIKHGGKNSKCTGCWQVYCDECYASKMFERFEKCKNIYKKLWLSGREVYKLTVAA